MSPEERLLAGWGRTAPSRANVRRPAFDDAVRELLVRPPRRGVLARGLGRSYGDVAQNAGGTVIDMTGFLGALSLEDDGTLTSGAGVSFDQLIRLAVPRGWFPPVTPGTRFVTLGGAIANDVHGKNHHLDGSIGRHLVSFDLMTPDGEVRAVTPRSDVTTWSATLGGLGLTGVILRATIKLRRIETSRIRVETERARDLDELMAQMASHDDRYRYSVAWVDCLARGASLGRGVLTRGDHATVDALDPGVSADPLLYRPRSLPSVPPGFPRVTSLATARAFNELWYRRAPRQRRTTLVGLDPFFFPLDAIPAWNRLYGRRGFVQHQSVVPFGQERAVVAVIERLAALRCPSFLGVLKRFGPGSGMLSFPMPGWTLALDVPVRNAGLAQQLDEIDRLVTEAGGRVYLGKDARLAPALVPAMYPELERWLEARFSLDPGHVMRSDLERRLELSVRSRKPVHA
jgi:decaprenylphospho-beta-D-ribofuranose 2-oxidase